MWHEANFHRSYGRRTATTTVELFNSWLILCHRVVYVFLYVCVCVSPLALDPSHFQFSIFIWLFVVVVFVLLPFWIWFVSFHFVFVVFVHLILIRLCRKTLFNNSWLTEMPIWLCVHFGDSCQLKSMPHIHTHNRLTERKRICLFMAKETFTQFSFYFPSILSDDDFLNLKKHTEFHTIFFLQIVNFYKEKGHKSAWCKTWTRACVLNGWNQDLNIIAKSDSRLFSNTNRGCKFSFVPIHIVNAIVKHIWIFKMYSS